MAQLQSWGMIILLVVVFYFFMIRPQQKRQKEIKKFREGLRKGSKVMTAGGIYGTIAQIDEQKPYVLLEVADGVRIRVDKGCIYDASNNDAAFDSTNRVNEEIKG